MAWRSNGRALRLDPRARRTDGRGTRIRGGCGDRAAASTSLDVTRDDFPLPSMRRHCATALEIWRAAGASLCCGDFPSHGGTMPRTVSRSGGSAPTSACRSVRTSPAPAARRARHRPQVRRRQLYPVLPDKPRDSPAHRRRRHLRARMRAPGRPRGAEPRGERSGGLNEIARRRSDLAVVLKNDFWMDARGQRPDGARCQVLPIYTRHDGHLSILLKPEYIYSAQRFDDVPRLSDAQREALELFHQVTQEPGMALEFDCDPETCCSPAITPSCTAAPSSKMHRVRKIGVTCCDCGSRSPTAAPATPLRRHPGVRADVPARMPA